MATDNSSQQFPGKPGVYAVGEPQRDIGQPRVLRRAEIGSLRQLSQRYQLFNPMLFHAELPEAELSLITEAAQRIQLPTEHVAVPCPSLLFDYGKAGTELGLPDGNILFGLPREQWEAVANIWRGMQFFTDHGTLWLVTQRMWLFDPFISRATVISDLSEVAVEVFSLVVCRPERYVYFRGDTPDGPMRPATMFRRVVARQLPDDRDDYSPSRELSRRMLSFTKAIVNGSNNPFADVEQQHGLVPIHPEDPSRSAGGHDNHAE